MARIEVVAHEPMKSTTMAAQPLPLKLGPVGRTVDPGRNQHWCLAAGGFRSNVCAFFGGVMNIELSFMVQAGLNGLLIMVQNH